MSFLFDSNVCIRLLRAASRNSAASPAAAAIRRRLEAEDAAGRETFVCAVVRFELLGGALMSADSEKNYARATRFLGAFRSLPLDDSAAERAAEAGDALRKSGRQIGGNDLLIAGIALANHLVVVTHNVSEFSRVPGLQCEDWEANPNESGSASSP